MLIGGMDLSVYEWAILVLEGDQNDGERKDKFEVYIDRMVNLLMKIGM
jgi:hypothetical protein